MLTAAPSKQRIHLSPPHMGALERQYVAEAFDTNWIAPLGPNLNAFEREMCEASGMAACVGLSSGTAALHLATRLLGVSPGDEVLCPTFTFIASANPIVYQGATPIFVDSELSTWNIDPNLIAEAIEDRIRRGKKPKAVMVTDIYGQCAQWDQILEITQRHEIPVIEDAAEAVGGTYRGRWAGHFGTVAAYSFNGNKILNTSGGGMLVSNDVSLVEHARKLATQAREPVAHYEHTEVGYNYRLSNVLAGIGRGQLKSLPARIQRRWEIGEFYRAALGSLPGVSFMPESPLGRPNRWLTCITVDPSVAGTDRDAVLRALEAENIEARPLWKPLHHQPVYTGLPRYGGAVAAKLFSRGLSLPSGSAMTEADLERVCETILSAFPS